MQVWNTTHTPHQPAHPPGAAIEGALACRVASMLMLGWMESNCKSVVMGGSEGWQVVGQKGVVGWLPGWLAGGQGRAGRLLFDYFQHPPSSPKAEG